MSELPAPPNGQRWVVFEDGRVAFLAPADFTMHREQQQALRLQPEFGQHAARGRISDPVIGAKVNAFRGRLKLEQNTLPRSVPRPSLPGDTPAVLPAR